MSTKNNILFSEAKVLRTKGFSLSDISDRLGISKSTASVWLKEVEISAKGLERIKNKKIEAITKSRKFVADKRSRILKMVNENCDVLLKPREFSKDDLKLMLALLFWGEGSKTERRVVFMNSDPEMIRVYLKLLRNSFNIDNDRIRAVLHLHDYHDRDEMLKFWSMLAKIKKSNIIIYNKKNTGPRKKEGYKGCISIRYGNSMIFDELMLIIERIKHNI